ncbi:hypothetical protein M8C21_032932, partial [Ambrosia artemisiifolia]
EKQLCSDNKVVHVYYRSMFEKPTIENCGAHGLFNVDARHMFNVNPSKEKRVARHGEDWTWLQLNGGEAICKFLRSPKLNCRHASYKSYVFNPSRSLIKLTMVSPPQTFSSLFITTFHYLKDVCYEPSVVMLD